MSKVSRDTPGGMHCPKCNATRLKVTDTRKGVNTVARRRACTVCKHRWSTWEYPASKSLMASAAFTLHKAAMVRRALNRASTMVEEALK